MSILGNTAVLFNSSFASLFMCTNAFLLEIANENLYVYLIQQDAITLLIGLSMHVEFSELVIAPLHLNNVFLLDDSKSDEQGYWYFIQYSVANNCMLEYDTQKPCLYGYHWL